MATLYSNGYFICRSINYGCKYLTELEINVFLSFTILYPGTLHFAALTGDVDLANFLLEQTPQSVDDVYVWSFFNNSISLRDQPHCLA